MVTELGLPVLESSTSFQNFLPHPSPLTPADSEHKFHKTGIKNWLPIGLNMGSS